MNVSPMPDMSATTPNITVDLAAAVNIRSVLENCLLRSPDVISEDLRLRTYEGFTSAALAYNAALEDSDADILILAHQDVYLPRGFLERFTAQIASLNVIDPDWKIAGLIGLDDFGKFVGHIWCTGNGELHGQPVEQPTPVRTLDELLLVVRRGSGFRFDTGLPGFHLYAADAIEMARKEGVRSYVLHAPVVHHSRPVVTLDVGYRRAYRYMQRKWRKVLPLPNLVCRIERSSLRLYEQYLRIKWRHRGRARPPEPSENPANVAKRLGFE
jgi:hypothetical protein